MVAVAMPIMHICMAGCVLKHHALGNAVAAIPVLAAASPNAMPRRLFCVFSLHYFKGASFAGFGALRARPALLLSAAGTTFSHSPLRASLAQMLALHNVRHAIKVL